MAREILFKAKRLDNGEWVEGHYYSQVYHKDTIEEEWYHFIKPIGSESWGNVRIDTFTLCQYTGLTDKNGNKIWENDIVKQENIGLLGTIIWTNGMFCIDDVYDGLQDYMEFIGQTEVIGNKFDNSELLEVLS